MASKKLNKICKAALVLILVFIWGNSLLDAPKSAKLSENVTKAVVETLEKATGHSFEAVITERAIRKIAHFSQFFCLGFFSFLVFPKKPKFIFFFGIAVSALDESIQYFIPGRGPQLTDVIIDSTGFFIGVFVSYLLFCLIFRRHKKAKS